MAMRFTSINYNTRYHSPALSYLIIAFINTPIVTVIAPIPIIITLFSCTMQRPLQHVINGTKRLTVGPPRARRSSPRAAGATFMASKWFRFRRSAAVFCSDNN